jgi:hypothetical protein
LPQGGNWQKPVDTSLFYCYNTKRYGVKMTVKLVLLKSGENIVSQIKEGYFENKLVCYILDKPCTISINGTYKILDEDENKVSVSLQPWPALSNQTIIELIPDWIVTIVDPINSIKKMYETQVLGIKENEPNQNIVIDEQSNSDQSD